MSFELTRYVTYSLALAFAICARHALAAEPELRLQGCPYADGGVDVRFNPPSLPPDIKRIAFKVEIIPGKDGEIGKIVANCDKVTGIDEFSVQGFVNEKLGYKFTSGEYEYFFEKKGLYFVVNSSDVYVYNHSGFNKAEDSDEAAKYLAEKLLGANRNSHWAMSLLAASLAAALVLVLVYFTVKLRRQKAKN